MNILSEKLGNFCKTRYNRDFSGSDKPTQLIAKLDFTTIVLYLIIQIEMGNKLESEIYIKAGEIINPIFKKLEYKIIDHLDALRTELEIIFNETYNELIKIYPYDIKSVAMLGQKEYEERR